MITVTHLSKSFGSVTPLKDVNAEIEKGEVISIIGPSGTGKSTFLRCLNLLETPTSGEIIIDGQNLLDKSTNAVSYTHLDVYKRQAPRSPAPSSPRASLRCFHWCTWGRSPTMPRRWPFPPY